MYIGKMYASYTTEITTKSSLFVQINSDVIVNSCHYSYCLSFML